ncbi:MULTISPECIES: allophanate hydrolase subunit 1 [Arthrobacter]|uniref:Carboxyltransferase domain-containing protein n=1 Tax=Arthrobacter terricola TaxID=2547396 RepID=A0A4R5KRC1_9MICC|nr:MULTISPECIES: carboxyltransferase domain-containing protein [Arthrobacter]MBT8160913.1 allophanate hydrolase subunit 1 [Arthrobacter sp. GN70]TDF97337.1 carboxyltransferase domain-containing protein [Arthrobacter terricola]
MSTQPAPGQPRQPLDVKAVPFGDSALMVSVAADDDEARQAGSRRLREILLEVQPHGLLDVVAGVDSLLVEFDCLAISHDQLAQTVRLAAAGSGAGTAGHAHGSEHFVIPMVVNEAFAPDLADVATELGISPEAVLGHLEASVLSINLLASAMAPMMGRVQFPGQVSRCREPRTNVDAGSVMVAGTNAIIQPFPGPTGWKVIGRTPLTICDIRENPPTSYKPGDTVQFSVVPESEWEKLQGQFLRAARGQSAAAPASSATATEREN